MAQNAEKQNSDAFVLNENNKLLNKGWSIIKPNTTIITPNTTIITPNKKKISDEETDYEYRKRFNYYRTKMINNWNNYRDKDISLLGNKSEFYNYKQEINEMLTEEIEIQEKIDAVNNDEDYDDDEYHSDEERNYHLVY